MPPPRYVLIGDRLGSGNLLGLLNTDRLLAYLRVRMRNLPTPSTLKVNVGDLSGIRWEERGWRLAEMKGSNSSSKGEDGEDASPRPQRICSTLGSAFYLQPTTTCREALHILNLAWNSAGLACLPVAAEDGRGLQGMITKLDIIVSLFLDSSRNQ